MKQLTVVTVILALSGCMNGGSCPNASGVVPSPWMALEANNGTVPISHMQPSDEIKVQSGKQQSSKPNSLNASQKKEVQKLIEQYSSNDKFLRIEAIEALINFSDPIIIPTLVDALDDDWTTVSGYAFKGLVKLSKVLNQECYIELLAKAVNNKNNLVKQRLVDTLIISKFQLSEHDRLRLLGFSPSSLSELYSIGFLGPIVKTLKIDPLGNIHIAGNEISTFDDNGTRIWSKTIPNIRIHAMNLDQLGNNYISGLNKQGEYVTLKFDSKGKNIWTLSSPLVTRFGGPRAIAISPRGDVFVVGTYDNKSDSLIACIKSSSDGKQLAIIKGDSANPRGPFTIPGYSLSTNRLMTVDERGFVFSLLRNSPFGKNLERILACFDKKGNLQWTVPVKGFGHFAPPVSIEFDSLGSLYLAGKSSTSKAIIVKISQKGKHLWTKRLIGWGIQSLSIGPDANIYAIWSRWPNRKAATLAKISPDGTLLWTKNMDWSLKEKGSGVILDMDVGVKLAVLVEWQQFVKEKRGFLCSRSTLFVHEGP